MIAFLGFWAHALAALLYGALALWQLRRWGEDSGNRHLVGAFAVTSAWSIFTAFQGPGSLGAGVAESARNFAFLGFMYTILSQASEEREQRAPRIVYTVVAAVIGLQLTLAGVTPQFADHQALHEALKATGQVFGLTIAAGSLVLVHNLYGQAAHESRWGIRLPMIALAGMWAYDLHLYTVAWLTRSPVEDLYAMRGAVLAMIVPLFALASRRTEKWRMQLSRAATFQSLSLIAILGYLILMMTASRALEIVGGEWVRIGQIGLVFAVTLAAVILLPSGRMRAWSKVLVAKHFFEHRYDYRQEWLRFTRTVALGGEAPLSERIIKAIADMADAPGGLLLVPQDGRLCLAARWNSRHVLADASGGEAELIRFLEASGHVLDFTSPRPMVRADGVRVEVPAALGARDDLWAGVPLIHKDRLVGLVLLEHPLVRRPLDWEDFDLFRTVGLQAASYLAEARTQEALADARRFDEFNRRFAFIIHDIKNLVSQLSLVIRNAERHADKPEFREDMIATLQSSVKKMQDLLARLHRGSNNVEAEPVRAIPIGQAAARVAEVKRRVHPVEVSGDLSLPALADPSRLEQALAHLVQNAIDASPDGAPVRIRCFERGEWAAVEVADQGCGMSADFIRTRLYQPFASTKESGFGVGAFEARSLVAAMGGRIEVESREGEGTRFTLYLPRADETRAATERMCA
ncbi:MAG TPA: XrtA/PEP-CTERM system histidine kinase PrsK [Allosphingosinicella sp.]|nr:XrtA/PEP-CTERM system histidine kinase PrsK [Allosphingosinicella sp.]